MAAQAALPVSGAAHWSGDAPVQHPPSCGDLHNNIVLSETEIFATKQGKEKESARARSNTDVCIHGTDAAVCLAPPETQ